MRYLSLILILLIPLLAPAQVTTSLQDGGYYYVVVKGDTVSQHTRIDTAIESASNYPDWEIVQDFRLSGSSLFYDEDIIIEEVTDTVDIDPDVYESPLLHDIQWGTNGAHDSTYYDLDLSFQSAADKVDFQLVCGTELAVQGGWLPQTTGRNGFVEHTFTLSCQKDIQIHFEASTPEKIYSISEHIPAFALQLTEAEGALVDSVKKKSDVEMALPNTLYALASVQQTPGQSLTDFTFVVDLSNITDQSFWDAVDTSDGARGRVAKDDGTQLASDWIGFDPVAQTGVVRFLWTGESSGVETPRIYPPQSTNASLAANDTHGQYNAYDSSWASYYPKGGGTDRTVNQFTMTAQDTITEGDTSGVLGVATDYSNGYYRADDVQTLGSSNRTFLALAVGIDTGDRHIFDQGEFGVTNQAGERYSFKLSNGFLRLEIALAGQTTSLSLSTTNLNFIGVRLDGTTFGDNVIFANGQSEQLSGTNTVNTAPQNPVTMFGVRVDALSPYTEQLQHQQLHSTARSNEWIDYERLQIINNATFWGNWTVESPSKDTALSGSINSQLALSGETKESATIAGQSLSQSSFAGNMYESAILSGLTGSNSLLSGDLSKRAALRGQIAGLSELQGSLVMNAVMSGQVSVESVLSGNVIVVDDGVLSLSGSVDAQTALSGNLSVLKQVRGIIESQTSLSGSVIEAASLAGGVLTVSATSAEAVVAQTLSGAAFVSSGLSGELSRLGEAWVGRIDITNSPMHTIQFQIKPMHTIQIQVKS